MFESLSFVSGIFDSNSVAMVGTAIVAVVWVGACLIFIRRAGPIRKLQTIALASSAQCALILFGLHTRWVILTITAWVLCEWLAVKMQETIKGAAYFRSWTLQTARFTGIFCVAWFGVTHPWLTWLAAKQELFLCRETSCFQSFDSAISIPTLTTIGFFILAVTWILQSGLMNDRAHRGQSNEDLFGESAFLRIPVFLFSWAVITRLDFLLPLPFGQFLITLGMLIFVLFQWIGITRNELADITGCIVSAHTGLFWAILGMGVLGTNLQALWAFFWISQLLLFALQAFNVWFAKEHFDPRERSLRGMLAAYPSIAIPGWIFLIGLAGQPWVASGVLQSEALSFIVSAGMGAAILFAFGFILQSTKLTHLAMVMALPGTQKKTTVEKVIPERSTAWALWLFATLAVALGFWPIVLRSWL